MEHTVEFEYPSGNKDLREEVERLREDSGSPVNLLYPAYLDEAVVGIDTLHDRVIYSDDLLVRAYMKDFLSGGGASTVEEAYEMAADQVHTDTLSACVGPDSPVIMFEPIGVGRYRDAVVDWMESLSVERGERSAGEENTSDKDIGVQELPEEIGAVKGG